VKENTGLRSKLKPYATPTWRNDVALLLRKEFSASSQPQYYRLDGSLSLESNLKRKAVVEFPVVMVVLRSELAQYVIANDRIEVLGTSTPTEPKGNEDMVGVEDDEGNEGSNSEAAEEIVHEEEEEDGDDDGAALVAASSEEDAVIDAEMAA
jgi:hypothetical protein